MTGSCLFMRVSMADAGRYRRDGWVFSAGWFRCHALPCGWWAWFEKGGP